MVQLADAMLPTRTGKLIVLDRDGVINYDSEHFIKSPDEWRPVPGSVEAIARLNHAGYRVVVATNQSGIGRGLFDMGTIVHEWCLDWYKADYYATSPAENPLGPAEAVMTRYENSSAPMSGVLPLRASPS